MDEENQSIVVFLEQSQGALENVSLELLSKGRQLADEAEWRLIALVLGHAINSIPSVAFQYGADEVWFADSPILKHFNIETYTDVTFQAIMQGKPSIFLCGATPNGRDLAGRLAVRLRTGLNADCTDLSLDSTRGVLISEVTGFGGGILALLETPKNRPQMATVRPGVFPPGDPEYDPSGKVVALPVTIQAEEVRTQILERFVGEGVDLTQAPILICGGRGVEGDFEMLAKLAELMGGEIGATRPPVDEGYIARERQIGQTGVVCRPKVAFACGISGAFHFVVGIQDADVVVAINSDPDAPIFEFADYCIVGDVFQILPALTQVLQSQDEVLHG
jgi:electron transfer flavoprotein alpha subunit